MSNRTATIKYHCYNDCRMQGCPGHEATIHIQTVSDAITFSDGFRSDKYYFDPTTIEVLLRLLKTVDYLPTMESSHE